MTDDATSDPKTAIKHLGWAAVPSAAAFILVLTQVLDPWASPDLRGLLYTVAALCVQATLAAWLWCAIVRAHRRDENADKRQTDTLAVAERIDRSNQALHRKLDGQAEEIKHLRKLVLGEDSYRGIGPSPYS